MDIEDPNQKDIEEDSKGAMFSRIKWVDKLHHKIWNGKHAGVFCMVISSSAYSIMGLLVKLLTRGSIPSSQIVMARCSVISILAGIGLQRMNYPFFGSPKARKLVIIRAILGFFALSAYFYSIQLLPLRDATMLNFTVPVFTAILATFFLHERWGRAEMIGTLLSLLGVLLVIKPEALFSDSEAIEQTKRNILIGTIMAVIGASTGALSYIVVRAIGQCGEPALVSVFAYAVFSTPMAGICLLFQGAKLPSIVELVALFLVGLTAYMAQIFLTRGLQLEKASRATSIQYVKVLITYFLGVVFLGEIPSIMGALGGFLIAFSSVFISLHQ
ncbi:hypothetical protein SUGI_1138850 [Cryptomeria japonica]|uniref:uncharacterized protein LOC131067654 isoform X1 n=1 Tax=Cryptomeria japonica TaxID=3369 RepID=UPI002414AC50|nr:uncharacterized protein LOC131067654 isoform X1 [Cryptomeria japonica]GLJ53401.1 hypothetical protein SUGI_1138850 [Cryptomeria japonica]